MSTATTTSLEQLRRDVEAQRRIVAEAEAVERRAVEWHKEQNTTASHAGLVEARRDLGFYKNGLRRLEEQLAKAEGSAQ
jgi:glutamate dehydrogenase/leucine dehydrogenase